MSAVYVDVKSKQTVASRHMFLTEIIQPKLSYSVIEVAELPLPIRLGIKRYLQILSSLRLR